MSSYVFHFPTKALHKAFKQLCAAKGMYIKDRLAYLVERDVAPKGRVAMVCLTQPELQHLAYAITREVEEGSYYGPRAQHHKRQLRLLSKLGAEERKKS